MPDFVIKRNDELPAIRATLSSGGVPVNLSTATQVRFIMAPKNGGPVKVNAPAVVVEPAQGLIRYDWVSADTDTPGSYQAEWEVTWADGKSQTYPTTSYHTIDVLADLDAS